jgi:hypothetical protein
MADGWHTVQMPAGQLGWDAVGPGTLTLQFGEVSGGTNDEAVFFGESMWDECDRVESFRS